MCRPTQRFLMTENVRSKVRILAEANELTPSGSADNAPAAGRLNNTITTWQPSPSKIATSV